MSVHPDRDVWRVRWRERTAGSSYSRGRRTARFGDELNRTAREPGDLWDPAWQAGERRDGTFPVRRAVATDDHVRRMPEPASDALARRFYVDRQPRAYRTPS
jgi:hypothetical protein